MGDSFAWVSPNSSKLLDLLTQWPNSCFPKQILLQVDGGKERDGEKNTLNTILF